MFGFRATIESPTIEPSREHQDCACVGIVVALPDGKLLLDFPSADALEAFGWAIAETAEAMKRDAALPVPAANGAHS